MNERNTEILVRKMLQAAGYYDDKNIIVEEQSSDNPKIDKLLKYASKNGNGKGFPEFIIHFKNKPDDLIVIECKAQVSKHESKDRKQPRDYAIDGALWYASNLKNHFNVTAIAVSGETEREKKISSFLWLKENYTYKDIQDKILLKPNEISNIIIEQSKPITEEELVKKAIEYNSFLHAYSIPEVERCTLISAILVALQNEPFLQSYRYYEDNKELIDALLTACGNVLKYNKLSSDKIDIIISEYSKFKNNSDFNSKEIQKNNKKEEINTILRDFIVSINEDILPYINKSQFDVLGKFYTQFIRYAGSDKKTGLVLTPNHITDFFCEVAGLNQDDIVFDPCCGTAGFLVSSMDYMLQKAGNDSDKKQNIKSSQLIGIEKRPDMFSHACSNMMMRGDGKSHILYGSCFDKRNKDWIKKQKPTKGFLNPPYQDGNADEQLEFIENTLECLQKDGICIAICQMTTAISDKKTIVEVRKRLLEKHTLDAVFSMPNKLFYPVGVSTCILVFKAHNPHPENKKSFFGYFKDDGFIEIKNKGRIDKENKWFSIKKNWLNAFINNENILSFSITQAVTPEDEWCAEAYLEVDYNVLNKNDFIKKLKEFTAFEFLNERLLETSNKKTSNKRISLQDRKWNFFKYKDVFDIKKGFYNKKPEENENGDFPFIGATANNNGVTSLYSIEKLKSTFRNGSIGDNNLSKKIYSNNAITVNNGGSIGKAFFQPRQFTCAHHITPIYLKNKIITPELAFFIIPLIELEGRKYTAFGREWRNERFPESKIKLPVNRQGKPDWQFMEDYIKSLPYSSNL